MLNPGTYDGVDLKKVEIIDALDITPTPDDGPTPHVQVSIIMRVTISESSEKATQMKVVSVLGDDLGPIINKMAKLEVGDDADDGPCSSDHLIRRKSPVMHYRLGRSGGPTVAILAAVVGYPKVKIVDNVVGIHGRIKGHIPVSDLGTLGNLVGRADVELDIGSEQQDLPLEEDRRDDNIVLSASDLATLFPSTNGNGSTQLER